jgi:hypothetical protein
MSDQIARLTVNYQGVEVDYVLASDFDRLEAELERLQRFIDSKTPGQCIDCPGGKSWEAEAERLRAEIARYKADPTLLLAVDESKVIYFPEEME